MTKNGLLTIYNALTDARGLFEREMCKARITDAASDESYYEYKMVATESAMQTIRRELIDKYRCDPEL